MKFKSPTGKDIQINLDNGLSATVFPDWCDLQPAFHREAYALGCISDNMSDDAIAAGMAVASGVGIDRKQKIRDALEKMMLDGKPEDFTANGQPKIGAVRDLVGIGIDREEMMAVWNEIEADADGE